MQKTLVAPYSVRTGHAEHIDRAVVDNRLDPSCTTWTGQEAISPPLWLGLLLGSLIVSGLLYAYLQCGWFESAHLGQVLQIRRMHAEGPPYSAQRHSAQRP
jgi:hypothetical protein